MIVRALHYFTREWKDTTGDATFIDGFAQRMEDDLGPFYGSDDESLSVSCSRSAGTLRVDIPTGVCNRHRSWTATASSDIGDIAIDVGANELSWVVRKDWLLDAARTELGTVTAGVEYVQEEKTASMHLKVGPLATRLSVGALDVASMRGEGHTTTNASRRLEADLHASSSSRTANLFSRNKIVSDFSIAFPPPTSAATAPHVRLGIQASNDVTDAPRVGLALEATSWRMSTIVALASCLAHARGCGHPTNTVQMMLQHDVGCGGWMTLTGDATTNVGRGVSWRHALQAADVHVGLKVTCGHVLRFPTTLRASLNRDADLAIGLSISLPKVTAALGGYWSRHQSRPQFGLELEF